MIFGINTTHDTSKLSNNILQSISKYNSWYLCQISLQIMLLPGFVRVLEILESPGILLSHFPGLESPGKILLVLESPGNLLN